MTTPADLDTPPGGVPGPPRSSEERIRARHWMHAAGTHVLIVDPSPENPDLELAMSSWGVHVTWASSMYQGLVEFGRTDPVAVIISPDASDLCLTSFVETIRRYASPFVVAALASDDSRDLQLLMLAGVSAVVDHPYSATGIRDVLQGFRAALEDHARINFGPLELDARAYTVCVHGRRIHDLPLKEFELLRSLMVCAPEVLTNQELRRELWGTEGDTPSDNTIAVHAARLRNRLQGVARIRRVRGRGYSLTID